MEWNLSGKFNGFIEWITRRLVCGLIDQRMISKEQWEEYSYGLQLMVLKLINGIVFLIILCFLPNRLGSLIFLLFLFLLRGQTGGLHASSGLRCLLGGCGVLVSAHFFAMLFQRGNIFWVAAGVAVASGIILLLTPVDHPNLNLSECEKKMCKKNVRVILGLELMVILLSQIVSPYNGIVFYECLAVMACAFFMLVGRRKRK